MKKLLFLVLVSVAVWWFYFRDKGLSESNVFAYYKQVSDSTVAMDASWLCDAMTDDFNGVSSMRVQGQLNTLRQNNVDACEMNKQSFAQYKAIEWQTGKTVAWNYHVNIERVEWAADK